LSATDCRRLLEQGSGKVGRLGFLIEGNPVVLPFNYMLLDEDVLLCLGPGSTLDALLSEPMVAFEIDHTDHLDADDPEGWSVLVQGNAQVIRDHVTMQRAAASGLTPLVGQSGQVHVLVRSEFVSGRRFQVAALARFGWHAGTS
jgi:nitroimidazol reductase NimA-like FMN-containing flavoprotein (pyridoxamine 5'-phosphate oxidase superfamily)